MKIFFYRYGSICEPDYLEGFKRLGMEIDTDETEIVHKTLAPSENVKRVSALLEKDHYLFVFTINFFPWLSDLCNILKIPYLCQIVDSPVLELYADALKNSCNRVFLFDWQLVNEFEHINPGHIYHLPLCANVSHFTKVIQNSDAKEQQKYSSDLSFIGSTYEEKCELNSIKLSNKWKGYVDGLVEAQLRVYGYNFVREVIPNELVKEIKNKNPQIYHFPKASTPAYKEMIADQFISVKVGEQERLRALKMLSQHFHVDMYTGSDTSTMPKIKNKGFAKSRTEMPLIFHNSKINLNITAKSIKSGLSQRIYDVLGCGGFLITNYQIELADQFEIGQDLVAYANLKELNELCTYYLHHENERKQIANNGFKKVQQLHNIDQRLLQMLNLAFPETTA